MRNKKDSQPFTGIMRKKAILTHGEASLKQRSRNSFAAMFQNENPIAQCRSNVKGCACQVCGPAQLMTARRSF